MRKKFLCLLFGACMLLGANLKLLGQQPQISGETVRLKQHPLRMNQSLGARVAALGEGRLRQVDVTLVEIPPGGTLAAHRHLAELVHGVKLALTETALWEMLEEYRSRELEKRRTKGRLGYDVQTKPRKP